MKQILVITSLAALLLPSCGGGKPEPENPLLEASRRELVEAIEERDQLLALVGEVASGMEQIRHLENILTLTEAQPKENAAQRAQIRADIAVIGETLRQRRERIAELEELLGASKLRSESLQVAVEALHAQIDLQTEEIENLRAQLTEATGHVRRLSRAVDSLSHAATEAAGERDAARMAAVCLENELNTCYYVVASRAELKEHQIIETGFLRKTKLLKGDFDKGFFVISDRRSLHTVSLGARKVRLLTNHPEGSYEIIEEEEEGGRVLRITDAEQFWSLSDYLVIQRE